MGLGCMWREGPLPTMTIRKAIRVTGYAGEYPLSIYQKHIRLTELDLVTHVHRSSRKGLSLGVVYKAPAKCGISDD